MTPSRNQIAIRHGRQKRNTDYRWSCDFFFSPVHKTAPWQWAFWSIFQYIKTQQGQMPAIPWEVTFKRSMRALSGEKILWSFERICSKTGVSQKGFNVVFNLASYRCEWLASQEANVPVPFMWKHLIEEFELSITHGGPADFSFKNNSNNRRMHGVYLLQF